MLKNILPTQLELLSKLKEKDPALVVEWDDVKGVFSLIRGNLFNASVERLESSIKKFLDEYAELFGPKKLSSMLKLLSNRSDDLGWTHLDYQLFIPVKTGREKILKVELYGSKLAAHFDNEGNLKMVQSSCWREIEFEYRRPITIKQLREILVSEIKKIPGYTELERSMKEQKEKQFPLMQEPRLVVHPWKENLILTWTTYCYGVLTEEYFEDKTQPTKKLVLGQVFVNALTGERLMFMPTMYHVETPDTGTGLGVTPLGGPYVTRNLNIVRVDNSSTYRLKDTTHARQIITYDAACNSSWVYGQGGAIKNFLLVNGTIPASEDTDGNKNWNHLPADSSTSERMGSQQPEVDEHYMCRELYEWYDALAGGRAGWDNGNYSDPPVSADTPIRVVAHVYNSRPDVASCRSVNAYHNYSLSNGKWIPFLAFYDGDPTATCSAANDVGWDFLAGSKFVVGHEYQHAITNYNFKDGNGNPNLPYPMDVNGLPEWQSAVHEGVSDVFGGLFSEVWSPGPEFSVAGMVFRNVTFPRDPNSWVNRSGGFPCGLSNDCKDHFADRNDLNFRYARGTILAHCSYLMGAGGVHHRPSRTPVHIPVYGMGRQIVNGKDVLKAARIWYRGFTWYFSTHGALMNIPSNDENIFRTLRSACVSAAEDLFSIDSLEYKTTVLAFYAVGLHPESYGADVTFLRWGADWWRSRQYLPEIGNSPDWSSLDLFINNGGISEWNAQVNVLDSNGMPTQFENNVYCRVRNIGDQAAQNIHVDLSYAKCGTGISQANWLPVTDKDGNPQPIDIPSLGAGMSSFLDSEQNNPPITPKKWYIPPLDPNEPGDHFCLRAVVTCSNEVNNYNNEVQSNIAYAPYSPSGFSMSFNAGNPLKEQSVPLELTIQSTLPKTWKVGIKESTKGIKLKPGEQRPFTVRIDMPSGAEKQLEVPFDGTIRGTIYGHIHSMFSGTLVETKFNNGVLTGKLAAEMDQIGTIVGHFTGTLSLITCEVKGKAEGLFQYHALGKKGESVLVGVTACLRPWRRVNISQIIMDRPIGGITIQVQVPTKSQVCGEKLPPTNTVVAI